ncbi:MAG TPA: hypothetical protein VEU77_02725 [Candidatus Acidoferrales bacterium]|nr:hypothetical protein [Candidatus Acidoferrales bacterium]
MPSTRDQRPYNVAYYASHREQEIERVTRRQQAALDWLRELRRVPCMDCGGRFAPWVMDFDHRDPTDKLFDLGAGKSSVMLKNRAVLEAEVAKCDIVCANCHRMRTHRAFMRGELRSPSFRRRRPSSNPLTQRDREKVFRRRREHAALLRAFKRSACMDCGLSFPWFVMEFDHRDGSAKRGLVSQMPGRVGLMTLLLEIEKCDIVCANCHRIRTYERRTKVARTRAGVA